MGRRWGWRRLELGLLHNLSLPMHIQRLTILDMLPAAQKLQQLKSYIVHQSLLLGREWLLLRFAGELSLRAEGPSVAKPESLRLREDIHDAVTLCL